MKKRREDGHCGFVKSRRHGSGAQVVRGWACLKSPLFSRFLPYLIKGEAVITSDKFVDDSITNWCFVLKILFI